MRISIFASGRGSNMEAIISAVKNGEINAEIGFVFSDKLNSKALKIASSLGLHTVSIDPSLHSTKEDYDKEIIKILLKYKIDLICLAGYLRLISPCLINKFRNRIINIHPSLLPSFTGLDAQKQALDYCVKITGATVHFVEEKMDSGPIIMQSVVPVKNGDSVNSLSERILEEEHRIFPLCIKAFVENRLVIKGRKVEILD